jgi:hypothetical protein
MISDPMTSKENVSERKHIIVDDLKNPDIEQTKSTGGGTCGSRHTGTLDVLLISLKWTVGLSSGDQLIFDPVGI